MALKSLAGGNFFFSLIFILQGHDNETTVAGKAGSVHDNLETDFC